MSFVAAALSAAAAPKSAGDSRSSCSSSSSTAGALLCRLCSGPSTASATNRPAPCARSGAGFTEMIGGRERERQQQHQDKYNSTGTEQMVGVCVECVVCQGQLRRRHVTTLSCRLKRWLRCLCGCQVCVERCCGYPGLHDVAPARRQRNEISAKQDIKRRTPACSASSARMPARSALRDDVRSRKPNVSAASDRTWCSGW